MNSLTLLPEFSANQTYLGRSINFISEIDKYKEIIIISKDKSDCRDTPFMPLKHIKKSIAVKVIDFDRYLIF